MAGAPLCFRSSVEKGCETRWSTGGQQNISRVVTPGLDTPGLPQES